MPDQTIAQLSSATFTVKVDGRALTDEVTATMSYAIVDDCTALPDMAMLSFHDPMTPGEESLLDKTGAGIGTRLQVAVASEDTPAGEELFDGEVTAIETQYDAGKHWLVVRAFDKGTRLFRNPRAHTYLDMTYADIVKEVAQRAGLSADVEATSGVHKHVYQHNQTDADFIAQLAAEVGYDFEVERGDITFKKPAPITGPDVELELGDQLLRYSASINADGQVQSVKVTAWDPTTKEQIVGTADATTLTSELDDASARPGTVAQAVGSAEFVAHKVLYGTQGEADAAARALAGLYGSSYAEVVGTARGNPKIKAGSVLKLANIDRLFVGMHRVTKSRHVFDNGTYQTDFECTGRRDLSLHSLAAGNGSPAIRSADRVGDEIVGVMVGIVTNIQDPETLGRVKVKLPAISTQDETDWVRVIQPGAGPNRGLFVLPEVNDEVIVAFEHGDIRRGYVIGGLWNGVDKPEQPAATDAANDTLDKRSFTSRGGHFLLFQDKSGDEFVQLATKDGKYSMKLAQDADGGGFIIDSDNKVVINAKSDVTIKTDAKLSIESASDITLKSQGGDLMLEGINVKVNATASLELKGVNTTLEGSGMGKVASNGVLEVKGSLVKIN